MATVEIEVKLPAKPTNMNGLTLKALHKAAGKLVKKIPEPRPHQLYVNGEEFNKRLHTQYIACGYVFLSQWNTCFACKKVSLCTFVHKHKDPIVPTSTDLCLWVGGGYTFEQKTHYCLKCRPLSSEVGSQLTFNDIKEFHDALLSGRLEKELLMKIALAEAKERAEVEAFKIRERFEKQMAKDMANWK